MVIHQPEGVRLQKVLAAAGIGSRRTCEDLIAAGAVRVDGQIVHEQGIRVIPGEVTIEVKGKRIAVDDTRVTVALHKPKGVVSTMSDPEGRADLSGYVAEYEGRLFHVGRLDTDTTGLLLLTNDGELANRLAHPTHGVTKTYVAKVKGHVPASIVSRLKRGVELDDGPIKVLRCKVLHESAEFSIVEVEIGEGRNRVVRRMFDAVGFPVIDLARTRFGPIPLGQLPRGATRALSNEEVGSLMKAAGL
jgi:23S rRNA pseudouridine2605 synthase